MTDEQEWRHYIGQYHDSRSGITERLLRLADESPYVWLAEALSSVPGPLLDLACGSAPTRDLLPQAEWVGVDSSAGELAEAVRLGRGPVVRANADALSMAAASFGAVCASMCLPVLTPLPRVLAEVRRVLRPGGLLAVLAPTQSGLSVTGLLGWARVMGALRSVRQPWPNPGMLYSAADLLRRSGLTVRSDERRVFALRLETPVSAGLLVEGLYLPRLPPHRVDAAKRSLARWARPGRYVELPLRRVVAERPADHPLDEP